MDYVGIDIGSTASKVVARGKKEMEFVLPTGWSSKETTHTIKEKLKENALIYLTTPCGFVKMDKLQRATQFFACFLRKIPVYRVQTL